MAGIAAAGGQFAITAAYCHAPAREISVYDYSQIIFSAGLGFVIFGQVPDAFSWLGYGIICTMAVLMFYITEETNSLFSVYTISENRNRGYYYEIKMLQ